MRRFEGRVALVTGAATGIGAAVTARFAAEGAAVVAADITPMDGGVECDVTSPGSCQAAVAHALECYGSLDVLANIAGIGVPHRIADVPLDEWNRILAVNLTGPFLMSQAALPALCEARGSIVNMSSFAAVRTTPYNAAYCAAKGGLITLTREMAVELASAGVRVNVVCPAAVDTGFLRRFRAALPEDADRVLTARAASLMGDVIAPEHVAASVAYLASDEAGPLTGHTLVIDGGASA